MELRFSDYDEYDSITSVSTRALSVIYCFPKSKVNGKTKNLLPVPSLQQVPSKEFSKVRLP